MIPLMSIMTGGVADVVETPPGYTYLVENARAFWRFDGVGTITQVDDLTGNGFHLLPNVSLWNYDLQYYDYRFADYSRRGVYRSTTDGLWIPAGHETLLRQSFEFHYVGCGFIFSENHQAGVIQSTNVFRLSIDNAGRIVVRCRFSASGETIIRTSTGAVYGTGSNLRRQYAPIHVRVQVNFEADTLRIWVNGGEFSTDLVSGPAVSAWSATYYPGTAPFGIGTYNNNNLADQGQITYYRDVFYAAFTDVLTDQQAFDVADYFRL